MAEAERDGLPRDLGGGLRLRRATPDDAGALAAFNRRTHSWSQRAPMREAIDSWTRDLLGGAHPTTTPTDFTVVEETGSGAIVSSLGMIAQTWSYGGVTIAIGRPELVGTDPAYRRRGLVRAQMALIHEWSAARGDLAQAITGIPWYYRQFGYEMALALDSGRIGTTAQTPALTAGQAEPYIVRPAETADLPFLRRTYEAGMARYALSARRDAAQWRYELAGRRAASMYARRLCVIEDDAGVAVGLLIHWPFPLEGGLLIVESYEVQAGTPWSAVTPSVLRYVGATAASYAEQAGAGTADTPYAGSQAFLLGTQHPAYETAARWLPQERRPYAWYLRVPDLPRFIRQVAPVLEGRLAASSLAGYSGERRLSFYRDGLRLVFDRGQLTTAEAWQPTDEAGGEGAFPELTFLHLLFGHRSLAEVRHLFPDCWADKETTELLDALFPALPSSVWALA